MKRLWSIILSVSLILGIVPSVYAADTGPVTGAGASYLTDTDNWGGISAVGAVYDTAADGDLDAGTVPAGSAAGSDAIGNKDNTKYPIELKIDGVSPTQAPRSAYLLVRAYDVDEYDGTNSTGEWDRVYFSSNPDDIALRATTTQWLYSTKPTNAGTNYFNEMKSTANLGALSGNNTTWNTTMLEIKDLSTLNAQDGNYYVGVTTHQYNTALSGTPNGWVVVVDWAQLVLDYGAQQNALITKGATKIVDGKMQVDTSFLAKNAGNYDMEISLIKTNPDGSQENLDTRQQAFMGVAEGTETPWNVTLGDNLDPNANYTVNIILFNDRGAGDPSKPMKDGSGKDIPNTGTIDPGTAEHIYVMTLKLDDIEKTANMGETINFTAQDFKDNFLFSDGTYNGDNLEKVIIHSLPNATTQGTLYLGENPVELNQEIPVAELGNLKFVPVPGFSAAPGTTLFDWNGYDGKQYGLADAKVTITMPFEGGLTLTASPQTIVGDGTSKSDLTATLLDDNGNPIPGVTVTFNAPAGGKFSNNTGTITAVTDANGKATVPYTSDKITGTTPKVVPVSASVNDTARGIVDEASIDVTFAPPTISGVVTSGEKNTPVEGATVRVTLDLNNDGKIGEGDFDVTVTTDAEGKYSVPVPEGDATYNLEITKPLLIGGVSTPITYPQTATVGAANGSASEEFAATQTVTGILLNQNLDQNGNATGEAGFYKADQLSHMVVYLKKQDPSDPTKYIYVGSNGRPTAFPLTGQGVFTATGLEENVEYTVETRYQTVDEQSNPVELVMGVSGSTVKLNKAGEMNIAQQLVDPFGTVTDAVTGKVIEGATVTLYYADTQRNKDKGRTAGTKVTLPTIAGFAPNNNKSPDQPTDANGDYAYMVYPEADYYLVVSKAGYQTQTTGTISVEYDIVQKDIQLQPIVSSGGGVAPTVDKLALSLTTDKNLVEESDTSKVTVDYKNLSSALLSEGTVTVQLPAGATVVDADGGTVAGNTITWKVTSLGAGASGAFHLTLKWPQLTTSEVEYDISGEFKALGNSAVATANAKIKVYSDRFGDLQHQRYILGYPDGQFKPTRSLTRAELAAIIARLSGNVETSNALRFTDVSDDYWAKDYIDTVTGLGYFNGFADGTFHPDQAISRGELAVVMARYLKLDTSAAGTTHFTDLDGYWAQDTIEALYRNKFLSGYVDNTFKPKNDIIRAEAVTLVNRMLYRGPLQGLSAQFPDVPASHWAFGDVQEATVSHESERNADGSETWKQNLQDSVK